MSLPRNSPGTRLARSIGRRLYRVLLLAYPPEFRAEHGDDAAELFGDACAGSWTTHGGRGLARRLVRAIVDVPRGGMLERSSTRPAAAGGTARSPLFAEVSADVRYAVRSIHRRPMLAAGVIVMLALGIGSNTAMFSVINATLLRPLPYRNADRVVYIRSRAIEGDRLTDPRAEDLHRWAPRMTSLERIEGRAWKSVLLTGPEGATRARMLEVTAGYLSTVGSRRIAGRELQPDDTRPDATPVVVLSERFWRGRYGARLDVIGRTIEVDGAARVVVGVVSDVMSDLPGLRFSLFGPLPSSGAAARQTTALGVAWLKPGVSFESARAELQSVSASVDDRGNRIAATLALPSNIFWRARALRDPQLALMAGVSLLLLIACANVAMLLLGAGQKRARELAVRLALGSTRFRLVRLLLVETLVLALIGGVLGLLIASNAVQFFVAMNPGVQLQTQLEAVRLDWVVASYALAIAVLTALACGAIPALQGSAAAPRTNLFESGRTASASRRWPDVFIGLEVAMALVLLVAGGLVGRTFLEMRLADPGFAADRVLGVQIALPLDRYQTPERRAAFFDEVAARAARLPGVVAVGIGYGAMPPSDFMAIGAFERDGFRGRSADVEISQSFVSPGHFDLMGIPVLAGTGLEPRHLSQTADAERPVVISAGLQRRFWPDSNPVGDGFQLAGRRGTTRYRIIGVAGDTSGRGLISPSCQECQWQMYLPLPASRQFTDVLLRLADGAPAPAAALRALITDIDPNVPADDELQTAAESLHGFLTQERFRAALFGGFAVLAVTLVAFGLLAVVFSSVKRRTREIGIRLALGAAPLRIGREILGQSLRPAFAGLAAGVLLAWLLTRTLASLLPGISATDPLVFAGSAVLLMTVAIAAILGPVVQATRVDPAHVLRSE
jgi:putative ABC transport system permease protein